MNDDFSNFEEFKASILNIAQDLKIDEKDISLEEHKFHDGAFSYIANGVGSNYFFEVFAKKRIKDGEIELYVGISDSSPPEENMFEFKEIISGFKSFSRVADAAVHNFMIKRNPVNLNNLFGRVPIFLLCIPNYSIQPQIEVLLSGIPLGDGNVLEVFKFRHVPTWHDYYRSFSYIFKFHTLSNSFLVAFPVLGALGSGGAFNDYSFAEQRIKFVKDRGGIVEIKNYDIEYEKLEKFLLFHTISMQNHLVTEIEINQFDIPNFTKFGDVFEREWCVFKKKFYDRNYRGALGDIRPLVQDALKYACIDKEVEFGKEDERKPGLFMGKLIGKKLMDGKFQNWVDSFTAFSNIGNHSKIEPTDEDLADLVVRKRVVLTIMNGIHLIAEVEKMLNEKKENNPS
jgi:hypothetical protein